MAVDLQNLGSRLRSQFETVKADRAEIEDRWLKDIRQYKGIYDPEEEARMDKNRSRSFTRMTRIKVKSVDARLMDLIFPAGSEDNWAIEPTPNPEIQIPPATLANAMALAGRELTVEERLELQMQEAKRAAASMEREIRDQLAEIRYRKTMKDVIHSGDLYGTGILKGPLVNRKTKKSWVVDATGNWTLSQQPILLPYIQFTQVWNVYPDTTATRFDEARFVFERNVLPKHFVLGLAERQDFNEARIRDYLRMHPEGDAQPLHWESELRRIGLNPNGCTPKSKRYEVLEYWGVLGADDLEGLGLELPALALDEMDEFWANVWILGSEVIKAELQPIEGVSLPYYAYYYDKDETSIFGEGIAAVMRDDQKGLNASIRAMQDNAAICAGPQFEANVDLMDPSEDIRSVYPFKVWLRSGIGVEAQYEALRVKQMPSHTQEFMAMAQMFANNIHEATIPSYMHGEATSKGSIGRTVGGLSLLMSAAQIALKDQLTSLDDDVMRPFIEGMYHWNMQFNPKPEIRGDFSVKVKGTSSLVAREVRAQNLEAFANATMNQFDAPFIDRLELNKQRAKVQELGDGIVVDRETAMRNQIIYPAVQYGADQQQAVTATVPGVQGLGPGPAVYQGPGPADTGIEGPVGDGGFE
jgi:hypothetical protein